MDGKCCIWEYLLPGTRMHPFLRHNILQTLQGTLLLRNLIIAECISWHEISAWEVNQKFDQKTNFQPSAVHLHEILGQLLPESPDLALGPLIHIKRNCKIQREWKNKFIYSFG
jgi:hypothetical protein